MEMQEMTYREAIRLAMSEEMRRDNDVMFMGEDKMCIRDREKGKQRNGQVIKTKGGDSLYYRGKNRKNQGLKQDGSQKDWCCSPEDHGADHKGNYQHGQAAYVAFGIAEDTVRHYAIAFSNDCSQTVTISHDKDA